MAKRDRKKQTEVTPPEAPQQSPEQAQEQPKGVGAPASEENKKEAIVEGDAPAGSGEAVEESVAPEDSGKPGKPTEEPPKPKKKSPVAYGIHDEFCVVDRVEFSKLIKQLGYGQPFDAYGIIAMLQKMLHLGSWEEAKAVTKTMLTKG